MGIAVIPEGETVGKNGLGARGVCGVCVGESAGDVFGIGIVGPSIVVGTGATVGSASGATGATGCLLGGTVGKVDEHEQITFRPENASSP